MSKIVTIGTALPAYKHSQEDILSFMQCVYALDATECRKLKFLYHHSRIDSRYSVIPDYGRTAAGWEFYSQTENLEPFPSLEKRMDWFNKLAPPLSVSAIENCLHKSKLTVPEITHLITVSCTGMSAPGLELQVMKMLRLPPNIFRTSVNFMGCYAAIHALKMADNICKAEPNAKVMIVCTELCTLHFQKDADTDNVAAGLLFADGAAAALVTGDEYCEDGLKINGFYAEVLTKGCHDMSWQISSKGFLMTLSSYIPNLIEEDFEMFVNRAMEHYHFSKNDIHNWCIHPGGKRILEAVCKSLQLPAEALQVSFEILKNYGNMSSPTILFVLNEMMNKEVRSNEMIFGAAFGPGLSLETMLLNGC